MGEARRNPMSPQFQGEMPDAGITALTRVAFAPSAAFLERNRAVFEEAKAKGESPPPLPWTDADKDVVVGVAYQYIIPSRVSAQHPSVVIPATEVRIPLLELKRAVKAKLEEDGNTFLASQVKLPDEAKSD